MKKLIKLLCFALAVSVVGSVSVYAMFTYDVEKTVNASLHDDHKQLAQSLYDDAMSLLANAANEEAAFESAKETEAKTADSPEENLTTEVSEEDSFENVEETEAKVSDSPEEILSTEAPKENITSE